MERRKHPLLGADEAHVPMFIQASDPAATSALIASNRILPYKMWVDNTVSTAVVWRYRNAGNTAWVDLLTGSSGSDFIPATLPDLPYFGAYEARYQSEGNNVAIRKMIDVSGQNNHLYQPDPSTRPVINTAVLNGEKVLNLTTNQGFLYIPASLSRLVPASTPELYMILKTDADPAADSNNQIHDIGTHANGNFYPFTDGNIYSGAFNGTRYTLGNPTPSLASWRCWSESLSATTYTARIDGTTFFTSSSSVAFGIRTNPMFFRRLFDNTYFKGKCAAMYIFNRTLTSGERTTFHAYLSAWTGLTIV